MAQEIFVTDSRHPKPYVFPIKNGMVGIRAIKSIFHQMTNLIFESDGAVRSLEIVDETHLRVADGIKNYRAYPDADIGKYNSLQILMFQ